MQQITYSKAENVKRILHTDLSNPDGEFAIQTVEDHEPLLDSVKVLRDDHTARGDLKHVARVPLTVVEKAMREGWYNDKAAWRKWCNDPDNRGFRVWEGRV